MSWDAIILNGKDVPASAEDMPQDWRPHPLGPAAHAKEAIESTFPGISWDDSGYCIVDGPDFSIEFHVREEEELDSIGVRVVGGGDPVPLVCELCRANSWVLFDCQISDFIDLNEDPSGSWQEFTAWRDRALDQGHETKD